MFLSYILPITLLLFMPSLAHYSSLGLAQKAFADDLTNELVSLSTDGNTCSSSFGIAMAFSLLYPASFGSARLELELVFGFDLEEETYETSPSEISATQTTARSAEHPSLVWNATAQRITDIYYGDCPFADAGEKDDIFAEACAFSQEPIVIVANSVWLREGLVVNASYASILGDLVRTVDFDSDEAGDEINEWAKSTTQGFIENVLPPGPISSTSVLVAVNSVYVQANWQKTFEERMTNTDIFYSSGLREGATASESHFMHFVEKLPYVKASGFQIVQLPFAGSGEQGNLSVILTVPYELSQHGMPVNGRMRSTQLVRLLPTLQEQRLAVALPKFQVKTTHNNELMTALKNVGLEQVFEPNSFCVIDGSCDAFVDDVIQKVAIDVNEHGVTAAATTATQIGITNIDMSQPELVMFDHPFQFFIHDANTDTILFEGTILSPGIPEDASKVILAGKHADEDFWKSIFSVDPSTTEISITVVEETVAVDDSSAAGTPRFLLGLLLAVSSLLV